MLKRILIVLAVILGFCGLVYASNHTFTARLNNAIVDNKTKIALKMIKQSNKNGLNKTNQHYFNYIWDSIFNKNSTKGYPINIAAKSGNYKVTKALIDKGVNLNVKTVGIEDTPLILVLKSDSTDKYKIANELIDAGAKIKYNNKENKSAIYYAYEQNANILINDDIIKARKQCIKKCQKAYGEEDIEKYIKREYTD